MKNVIWLFLVALLAGCISALPVFADAGTVAETGGSQCAYNRAFYIGAGACVRGQAPTSMGGDAVFTNGAQPLLNFNLTSALNNLDPMADNQFKIPGSAMPFKSSAGGIGVMKSEATAGNGGLTTAPETQLFFGQMASHLAAGPNAPDKQMHQAKSNLDAQGSEVGNNMADLEKQQAASAIDFCASFLPNFTTDGGNKWNTLRNNIFLPMAILLLLPGAVATQARAIVAQGNPVLGDINPLEGLQRSLIAIFLIPGTYLVLNYSIDFNNSVIASISDEYTKLFGADMYRDAISFHIRAFPSRQPGENRNALDQNQAVMTPLLGGNTPFARFEGKMIENKIEDPVAGIYQAPIDRADEAIASSAIMAKTMFNSTNATFMIAWNILCAFQMVYFYYLWFVGPITGALWAWPMKTLRNAFPSWCEGVVTLGFWSLFWHTSILLMACFRGVDETGTIVLTALNFLATSSVKYAFDFAGLAKAAGQEAAQLAEKAAQQAGKGGGGGGGHGGGKGHGKSQGGHHQQGGGDHRRPGTAVPGGVRPGVGAPVGGVGDGPLGGDGGDEGDGPRTIDNPMGGALRGGGGQNETAIEAFKNQAAKMPLPPGENSGGNVRTLPGSSFRVGGEGADGTTFSRSTDDQGKGWLTIRDSNGNLVNGTDGKPLGPIDIDAAAESRQPINFEGGSVSIEKDARGGELYHASSHGHTDMVAFAGGHLAGHDGAAVDPGMRAAMFGNHPMAELSPGVYTDGRGGFFGADQKPLANGADLGNGRTLNYHGDDVSITNANGQVDNYHLYHGNQGELGVRHTDGQGHLVDTMGMHRDATGLHSFHADARGNITDTADVNGAQARNTYYNPDTHALQGYTTTNFDPNGGSVTNFYRDDNSLVGSNAYSLTDDGYKDIVYDGDGNPVSYEQASYNTDGSYSFSNASFVDGDWNGTTQNFNSSGVLQSTVPIEHQKVSASDMAAMMGTNMQNPWGAPAAMGGVVPDGGVFGTAQAATSESHGRDAAPSETKMLPVDLAGTSLQTDFSQIGGAYAAQNLGQANTAEVAYSSPVTTSNIDVVPPNIWDNSTPIAYQAPEKFGNAVDNRPSLESALSDRSGELKNAMDAATRFNVGNEQAMPPTQSFFSRESSSDGSQPFVSASKVDVVPPIQIDNGLPNQGGADLAKDAASAESSRVLPVDLAGTALNTEFSQIGGAYAAQGLGQANTAEVAYTSPVTTSNIDVVPPNIWDNSTPVAYQDPGKFDNAVDNRPSLESALSDKSGELKNSTDAATNFTFSSDQALPPQQFSMAREASGAPDQSYNHFTHAPQSGDLNYSYSQLAQAADQNYSYQQSQSAQAADQNYSYQQAQSAQAADQNYSYQQTQSAQAADQNYTQVNQTSQAPQVLPVDIAGTQGGMPQQNTTDFSQVGGAYSQVQASQGNTAEVAYTSPVTTSSVDVVPPAVSDSAAQAYARDQLASSDVYSTHSTTYEAPPVYDNTVANRASLEQISSDRAGQITAASPDTTYQMGAIEPPVTNVTHSPDQSVTSHYTEAPQVAPGPDQSQPTELPHTRTESAAQIASAAAIAMNAQHNMLGDAKANPTTPGGTPGNAPKRGLGTIFSDITMGKKSVKPGNVPPKIDPAAQAKQRLAPNNPQAPGTPGGTPHNPGVGQNTTALGRDATDANNAGPVSTNQSLQRQMMDAGAHVQSMPASSTLGSILNRSGAASQPQKPNEHLTSALVDYHTVTSLIHEGKTNEAALVAANALENISRCAGTEPQLLPLVKAFVTLFQQKNMIHQAKVFMEKERSLEQLAQAGMESNANPDNQNIWGS